MRITYHVDRHDEGWAYRLGDVWSESFPTHDEAFEAARQAAARQQVEGKDTMINYQTADGSWKSEYAAAGDRPEAGVED
jgi:hypothetical protein